MSLRSQHRLVSDGDEKHAGLARLHGTGVSRVSDISGISRVTPSHPQMWDSEASSVALGRVVNLVAISLS